MSEPDIRKSWNRDDEQKPGDPPSTVYVPDGAEASAQSNKTMTDPISGAPHAQPPEPNEAETDERPA
jgi:hypothetical protein